MIKGHLLASVISPKLHYSMILGPLDGITLECPRDEATFCLFDKATVNHAPFVNGDIRGYTDYLRLALKYSS